MKISIRSIEMRLTLGVDLGGGAVAQTLRLMLLRDGQANGAAPAALTDFVTPGTYLGLRALVNRKRFSNMFDKSYVMTPVTMDYSRRHVHLYMKLRKPLVCEYNAGTTGTVADVVTNSLWLITMGSEVSGATDGTLAGNVRIRYTDM